MNGRLPVPSHLRSKIYEITKLEVFKTEDFTLPATRVIKIPAEPEMPNINEIGTQGSLIAEDIVKVNAGKRKIFRLAVSGDVDLYPNEYSLVDTREFQRLRSVKQLGTANLVYPSATHTRFEHSIGTLHEAQRIIDSLCDFDNSKSDLEIKPKEQSLIRLAALLHDLGHIPFGHTLEDETGVVTSKHDDVERRNSLLRDTEIGRLIDKNYGHDTLNSLIAILSTKHEDVWRLGDLAYIADIVNNTLCADLLDYLKRDIYYCNLHETFGDRFMRYLCLEPVANDPKLIKPGTDPKTSKRLVVRVTSPDSSKYRRDVLSELVNLLRIRYTLGERVYYHQAKISTSAMVARAVHSAMQDESENKLTMEKLLSFGDDQLLSYLATESKSRVANRLARGLLNHKLHKAAYVLTRKEVDAVPGVDWASALVDKYFKAKATRTEVEDQIASLCGLEPGDVLIYCTDLDMAKKYARMLISWKNKTLMLRDIDDEATSIALKAIETSHDLLWNLRVYVRPDVKDARTLQILRGFCESYFTPPTQDDPDGKLEAAYRNLVNYKMEEGGADTVIRELVASHRHKKTRITLDDVMVVINSRRTKGG